MPLNVLLKDPKDFRLVGKHVPRKDSPEKSNGKLTGWRHRLVGQSIMAGTVLDAVIKDGVDPLALRLRLLVDHPRHRGVLRLAAEKAGWGMPHQAGPDGFRRGRGIAVHESFHSYVAQVAEVTVAPDGRFGQGRSALRPKSIRPASLFALMTFEHRD